MIQRSRRNYYFNGSRPSHLLALRLRNDERLAEIPLIKSSEGDVLTDPKQINNEFCKYYKDLYSSSSAIDKEGCKRFLNSITLPRLSEEDGHVLGAPLTLNEIEVALKSMKKGKSPGRDGIPPEFYHKFWDKLGPYLLAMFQAAVDKGSFTKNTNKTTPCCVETIDPYP